MRSPLTSCLSDQAVSRDMRLCSRISLGNPDVSHWFYSLSDFGHQATQPAMYPMHLMSCHAVSPSCGPHAIRGAQCPPCAPTSSTFAALLQKTRVPLLTSLIDRASKVPGWHLSHTGSLHIKAYLPHTPQASCTPRNLVMLPLVMVS